VWRGGGGVVGRNQEDGIPGVLCEKEISDGESTEEGFVKGGGAQDRSLSLKENS